MFNYVFIFKILKIRKFGTYKNEKYIHSELQNLFLISSSFIDENKNPFILVAYGYPFAPLSFIQRNCSEYVG